MSRGGRREGAGRKQTSRFTATACWRVTPETKDWLMQQSLKKRAPIGAVIEELINRYKEERV